MSQDRVIPAPDTTDLPTFTVLVDGSEISGEYQVLQVAVTKGVNMVATARVCIYDGDPAKEDFEISETGDFLPGNEIEVQAGYHSDEETIFKGIIMRQGIQIDKSGGSLLVVDCKDEAVKMTIGRKNAYFFDQKDSDIIDELIGNYSGLKSDVESTSATHKQMVQYYSTDWDFMAARAERNGLLIFNDDGEVKVAKPDTSGEPVVSLVFGATILELAAEMDARLQYKAVKSVSWDMAEQAVLEMDGSSPSITEAGNVTGDTLSDVIGLDEFRLHHTGKVIDQELQAWADATLMRSRLSKIQGNVTCQGFATAKPGAMIELAGLGDRFNGKVFVAGVRQELTPSNWETKIEFGLSPKWFVRRYPDVDGLPAAGLLPGIQGLHVGIVVALEGDPDGEDRIRVRVPVISDSEEGCWCRLASLDAGDTRGWVFRPEIDDEVVVGFMNNDPRDGVVLGHLNSSKKPAHIPGADDNHLKGLKTRGEMEMIFDDDKIIFTLKTPKGNTIVLDEDDGSILVEDENGNKMYMSSAGIDIESPGEINIKATKDVNIEGMNINVKASTQLKAEGSAGAELSSGATCVVKGSLVQIN